MKGGFFKKKILYNNMALRIISLAAAVVFWFIVVTTISPEYHRTISGVKINFNENSSTFTSLGLHVIDKSDDAVNIAVNGPRNVIGKLTGSDFSVTPSIGVIPKSGAYHFKLNAVLKSADSQVQIVKVKPSSVTVNLDELVTLSFPVTIRLRDNNVPDGYLLQTVESNPSQISVSGPLGEVSKISKAVAYASIGYSKSTFVVKSDVSLLDSKNKQLNLNHAKLSNSSVDITIPILRTRNLPLKVDFSNIPDGFDKSNISCTISPRSITIGGDVRTVSALSQLSIGTVDFTKLGLTTKKTFTIPSYKGVTNVGNVNTATVTIRLKNTSTRTMSTGSFKIINQPSGYNVTYETKKITGIRLCGPSSGIGKVKSVTAVVDMSNIKSGTGQRELPVTFTVPGKKGYWVSGSYKAVVVISKKIT